MTRFFYKIFMKFRPNESRTITKSSFGFLKLNKVMETYCTIQSPIKGIDKLFELCVGTLNYIIIQI